MRFACCCYLLTLDSDALQPAIFISHLQLRGAFLSTSSKKARARASSTHRPNHSLNKLRVFPPAFTCLFANYCTGRCKHLICQFSRLAAAALPLIKLHQAQAVSGVTTKRRVAPTSACIAHAGAVRAHLRMAGVSAAKAMPAALGSVHGSAAALYRNGIVLKRCGVVPGSSTRGRSALAHWHTGTRCRLMPLCHVV